MRVIVTGASPRLSSSWLYSFTYSCSRELGCTSKYTRLHLCPCHVTRPGSASQVYEKPAAATNIHSAVDGDAHCTSCSCDRYGLAAQALLRMRTACMSNPDWQRRLLSVIGLCQRTSRSGVLAGKERRGGVPRASCVHTQYQCGRRQ